MTAYVLSKFHGGDGEEWLGAFATLPEARTVMKSEAASSYSSDRVVIHEIELGHRRSEWWTEHKVEQLKGSRG